MTGPQRLIVHGKSQVGLAAATFLAPEQLQRRGPVEPITTALL
jgi:hypothetical protein